MIVHCGDNYCKYNDEGCCANIYSDGITLGETLGGQMVCTNQCDLEPICETCKYWYDDKCAAGATKNDNCWENPFRRD